MFKCSNCGQLFREMPKVSYLDGSGGLITGPGGCTGCASGRDAILEEK